MASSLSCGNEPFKQKLDPFSGSVAFSSAVTVTSNTAIPAIMTPSPTSRFVEFTIELEMELLIWFILVSSLGRNEFGDGF